jgi:hypothetical protein
MQPTIFKDPNLKHMSDWVTLPTNRNCWIWHLHQYEGGPSLRPCSTIVLYQSWIHHQDTNIAHIVHTQLLTSIPTLCKNQIEGRTGIRSTSELRTSTQRTVTNISIGWNEHTLLLPFSSFFFLFLPPMERRGWSQSIPSKTDRNQLGGQIYSRKPFTVVGSNHDKTEK